MRFSNKKSVEGYIKTVRAEFKKGTVLEDILKKSAAESVEAAKKANPELVKAAVDYILYAESKVMKGFSPSQAGWVEDSCDERKALQKAFTCDTEEKRKLFKPDWWLTGYNLFIYHLLEAVFDASLLVEQGAERKFGELVEFYRSFFKDDESVNNFFAFYDKKVLYIDVQHGQVFSVCHSVIKDRIRKRGIKGFERVETKWGLEYHLVYKDGTTQLLKWRDRLLDTAFKKEHILKDNNKAYYQVVLKPADLEQKQPAVQLPAHIILLLAEYGLDAIKQTICKDSLITCDHVDMCGNNNKIWNLQLVSRRDNTLRAKCKNDEVLKNVYGYDLGAFYKYIEGTFQMNKKEVKFQQDYTREFWEGVLKEKSALEVLAV